MCKELTEELDKGDRLAKDLVQHVFDMGANGAIIPIELQGKKFEIVIKPI